jgi:15-cis-phytoene synthase
MQACSADPEPTAAADLATCRKLLNGGSRTFFLASLLLPTRLRDPAAAIYAFCRLMDDMVDADHDGGAAAAALRERLDQAYAGQPLPSPVDRAFADAIACFAIPRVLPEAMLEGFAWDLAGRRYEDLAELCGYAVRVAGTVGVIMASLMGAREPETVARACDLGVAMQLTNIARDVGEDARAGRLYLPLSWLREAGIEPEEWLARPVFSERLGHVVARLLRAAEALYRRADGGIARLPAGCRPGIRAARMLYAEIGREIERRGCDSVSFRAVVPRRRKLQLLSRALLTGDAKRRLPVLPLPQARFLVDAVADSRPARSSAPLRSIRWWSLADRVVWVLDLFERLECREQFAAADGRAAEIRLPAEM